MHMEYTKYSYIIYTYSYTASPWAYFKIIQSEKFNIQTAECSLIKFIFNTNGKQNKFFTNTYTSYMYYKKKILKASETQKYS
jgi:hypothetical protein